MLELLAGLMILQSTIQSTNIQSAYESERLSGFVAMENTRAIDGIGYGDGLISAGLIYAHPGGFFAGSELLAGRGKDASLPSGKAFALQTFAGYTGVMGEHRFAVELLDYRLAVDPDSNPYAAYGDGESASFDHQGIALHYRHGAFELELAREFDRPYFYDYDNRFFHYDTSRLVMGWEQDIGRGLALSLGAGMSRIDRIDVNYRFFTGALNGQLKRIHWRIGYSHASGEIEEFYGGVDRGQWLLRIAIPFRVF